MLRRGFGFRPGRRQQCRQRLGQGGNGAGPTAASPVSDDRSGQLRPTDGCPATGRVSSQPLNRCPAAGGTASNSNRRTGPGTESCVKSAWSGPRCLRRATSNPQRQHPSWGLWGERIILTVNPGNRESCPQDFYGWKPWQIQTTRPLSQSSTQKKTPCATPPEISPNLLTGMSTPGQFTYATAPG